MYFTDFPEELQLEILYNTNVEDIVNLCNTNKQTYQYCKNNLLLKYNIINKLNTNYHVNNLTFDQLLIFLKTYILTKKLSVYEGIINLFD
jgi:hypothetical protein